MNKEKNIRRKEDIGKELFAEKNLRRMMQFNVSFSDIQIAIIFLNK